MIKSNLLRILFLVFFALIINSSEVLANEICHLIIKGNEIELKTCNNEKLVDKNKEALTIQLRHALLFHSDFESIIKKKNPIYRSDRPQYRKKIQDFQWERSIENTERLTLFIDHSLIAQKKC